MICLFTEQETEKWTTQKKSSQNASMVSGKINEKGFHTIGALVANVMHMCRCLGGGITSAQTAEQICGLWRMSDAVTSILP